MKNHFEFVSYLEQAEKAINHLEDKVCGGSIYQVADYVINADDYFLKPEHIYVASLDSQNFPLTAPFYFAVDVAERQGCDCSCPCPPTSVISATQTVWDASVGNIWRRLGTVATVEGQKPKVAWSEWKNVQGADCNCTKKLNAAIEFFIYHEGCDDNDGLSETTAMATWQGFFNKYITGPGSFDANVKDVIINFGPGVWSGNIQIRTGYFANAANIYINGAGMDKTTFSNPSGNAFNIIGSINKFWLILQNFTLENYSTGIYVNDGRVSIDNIKIKAPAVGGVGDAFNICYGGVLTTKETDAKIYFENYTGRYPFLVWARASLLLKGAEIILSGSCSWTIFFNIFRHSEVSLENYTFSGNGTGRKFYVKTHSLIQHMEGDINSLPGSMEGIAESSSFGLCYAY
ncbi:hypothetical protein C4J81_12135 [Deltaproteobacteria bacterium Smac51]|nr:hypothetical protein C4J81_12135 [Deltaproteobacteria bacterium Smac51]